MPPKKNIKLDLGSFLTDTTFGSSSNDSWADDFDPSMLSNSASVGINIDLGLDEPPIPENPPYTARIASLPPDCTGEDIEDFITNGLKLDSFDKYVEDFFVPRDLAEKGYSFVTFTSRDLLVDVLNLNNHLINGKQVYVSVAKPPKNPRQERGPPRGRYESNVDWSNARGSATSIPARENRPFPPRGDRRPLPDSDWSGARGSATSIPARENRPFPPRGERRPQPDADWSGARGSAASIPVRESRPFPPRGERKPQPEADWSGARGSAASIPVREDKHIIKAPHKERKPDAAVDWSDARGSAVPVLKKETEKEHTASTSKFVAKKTKQDEFDWNSARTNIVVPKKESKPETAPTQNKATTTTTANNSSDKKETPSTVGPKKSMFSVLATEEDEDDAEEEEKSSDKENNNTSEIVDATSKLSLKEEEGWEKVK